MATIMAICSDLDRDIVNRLADHLASDGHTFTARVYKFRRGSDGEDASHITMDIHGVDIILAIFPSTIEDLVFNANMQAIQNALSTSASPPLVLSIIVDGAEPPDFFRATIRMTTDDKDFPAQMAMLREHINRYMVAEELTKREEQRAQVKKSAATYIQSTQETLSRRESSLRLLADTWYMISYGSLAGALGLSIWKGLGITAITSGFILTGYLLANLITAVLFIAISKLSFTLAKGYIVESVRIADRSHAIAFGEFYLNAFEEKIEWSEVKDVFQHWNIDRGSSFISQEAAQFDPKLLETALEIAKVLKAQEKA